jgi:uncharacterized SAM-binding protein YcdF (DUF218 family)
MMLFLKKLLGRLLSPLPIGLELLVAGLIFWRFTRRKRLGKALVITSAIWMALIGYPWLPELLLPGLTKQYPPLSAAQVQAAKPMVIAVPGMGMTSETRYPANLRFPLEFITRLIEAVRVHRLSPGSRILVSVSNPDMEEWEKKQALDELMGIFGVDPEKVTVLTGLKDTGEEIQEFQRRSVGKSVCLVSSAANLPRAMLLARRHGLNAIASPSSQGGILDAEKRPRLFSSFTVIGFFPRAENLAGTELAFYERLGLAFEKLKGGFGAGAAGESKE